MVLELSQEEFYNSQYNVHFCHLLHHSKKGFVVSAIGFCFQSDTIIIIITVSDYCYYYSSCSFPDNCWDSEHDLKYICRKNQMHMPLGSWMSYQDLLSHSHSKLLFKPVVIPLVPKFVFQWLNHYNMITQECPKLIKKFLLFLPALRRIWGSVGWASKTNTSSWWP